MSKSRLTMKQWDRFLKLEKFILENPNIKVTARDVKSAANLGSLGAAHGLIKRLLETGHLKRNEKKEIELA